MLVYVGKEEDINDICEANLDSYLPEACMFMGEHELIGLLVDNSKELMEVIQMPIAQFIYRDYTFEDMKEIVSIELGTDYSEMDETEENRLLLATILFDCEK